MIFISHRGNLTGKNPILENTTSYIDSALNSGFNVEIDIWYIDNNLYLGHDSPDNPIELDWIILRKDFLWIHCKNIEALIYFKELDKDNKVYNYFWHESDHVTLTSLNFIWAYPGKQPIKNSIAVLPEIMNDITGLCAGICSDFIKNYKNE